MTNLNPVAHVGIPATDPERAMRFYAAVYFTVDDIDVALARAEAAGSEALFQKSAVVDGVFVAEIRDREGNRIALQSVTTSI